MSYIRKGRHKQASLEEITPLDDAFEQMFCVSKHSGYHAVYGTETQLKSIVSTENGVGFSVASRLILP